VAETPDRFCKNCGHELRPEDQFCPNCGTPVHRAAHVPTPEADVPVPPPPGQQAGQAARRRALTPAMMVSIGVVLVLLLGVGSVAALTLLRGGTESPEAAGDQREAPSGATETPRPKESVEKPTPPKTAKEGNDAENAEKEPTPEEASGPAPGYNLVQSPDGGLSVEMPQSWGVETGANSEITGRTE
jgi:hypothetical protein